MDWWTRRLILLAGLLLAPVTLAYGQRTHPDAASPAAGRVLLAGPACPEASAPGSVLVATSADLAAALNGSVASAIVLSTDVMISSVHFSRRSLIVVRRQVTITACSGGAGPVTLDLGNNIVSRVLVTDGGRLAFAGPGLRLANAPPVMRDPLWPDNNALLIGLIDINGTGSVQLSNLTVATRSPINATLLLSRYPPAYRPDYAVGPNGASVTVRSWNVTHQAYTSSGGGTAVTRAAASGSRRRLLSQGGSAAAWTRQRPQRGAWSLRRRHWHRQLLQAAAPAPLLPASWPAAVAAAAPPRPSPSAAWSFRDVVLDMPNTLECYADKALSGFATSSGEMLKQQLRDPALAYLRVIGDIVFDPVTFPPEDSNRLKEGKGLNVSHKVEIRGCSSDPFSPNVIDFTDLPQYIYVYGRLVFSGNLRLVNSWPSPRRAGLWELIGALSVEEQGVIVFEGVTIWNAHRSPFHDFSDPFWTGHSDPAYVPNPADFVRLAPPPDYDRDVLLVNYTFVKQAWVRASQGTTGVVTDINGTGIWSYVNAPAIWDPSNSQAPAAANAAALGAGLGAGLGGGLLLACAAAAAIALRRRRGTAAAAGGGSLFKGGRTAREQGESAYTHSARPLPGGGGGSGVAGDSRTGVTASMGTLGTEERIEEARQQLIRRAGGSSSTASVEHIVLQELLGEGSFGKVYKALWKGTVVAVKTMVLPSGMSGQEKREKMAIMETAISSSLSHPNIVHTYTYTVSPVCGTSATPPTLAINGQSIKLEGVHGSFDDSSAPDSTVHSWEVRLVLEYCDRGTMRELLNKGCFKRPDGGRDLAGVVATALDVARAMVFLHENHIVHADLKARNVLLKSTGTDPRGFTAKVGDFGLSIRIDPGATHISNLFQGTMTHMAPETLDLGRISLASDVYAFGILLYELYTGDSAFKGVAKAMLGYEVVRLNTRPVFPPTCPFEYQLLAVRCWESDPAIRPTFDHVVHELQRIQQRIAPDGATLLPPPDAAYSPSDPSFSGPAVYPQGGAPPGAPGGAPGGDPFGHRLGAAVEALHMRMALPAGGERPGGGGGADAGGVDASLSTGASLSAQKTGSLFSGGGGGGGLVVSGGGGGGGGTTGYMTMAAGGPKWKAAPPTPQPPQPSPPPPGSEDVAVSGISGESYEPSVTTYSMWEQQQLLQAAAAAAAAEAAAAAAAAEAAAAAAAAAAGQRAGAGAGPAGITDPQRQPSFMGRIEEGSETATTGEMVAAAAPRPGALARLGGGRGASDSGDSGAGPGGPSPGRRLSSDSSGIKARPLPLLPGDTQ